MFRDTCGAQAGAYKLAFLRAAFVLQTDFEMQKSLVASVTATVRDLQVRFDNSMQCKSVKSGKGYPEIKACQPVAPTSPCSKREPRPQQRAGLWAAEGCCCARAASMRFVNHHSVSTRMCSAAVGCVGCHPTAVNH